MESADRPQIVIDWFGDDCQHIGHGVWIQVRDHPEAGFYVAYLHPDPSNTKTGYCYGCIRAGQEQEQSPTCWLLVSKSPITVAPSLLCRGCGHHGFIRDGRWVPA